MRDTVAALQLPFTPLEPTSFTTAALGRIGVSVLLTRSLLTDSEAKPFGVTRQVQHDTSCSSGE